MDYNERNDWDERYRKWKEEKDRKKRQEEARNDESKRAKIIEFIKKEEEKVERVVGKEVKDIEKEVRLHKGVVIGIGIFLILIILGVIIYVNYDPSKIRYQYIDIEVRNASGLPMNVYYKERSLFSLSGWESMLKQGNQSDRLYGNEQYRKIIFDDKGKAYTYIRLEDQIRLEPLTMDPGKVTRIGWFSSQSDVRIEDNIRKEYKKTSVSLGFDNVEINYLIPKKENYFKVMIKADNYTDFSLGFVLNGYDIYLPNGSILINDHQNVDLNKQVDLIVVGNLTENEKDFLKNKVGSEDKKSKAIQLNGTSTSFDDTDYEIFVKNDSAIIVFSEMPTRFENLFKWNVFRIGVDQGNNAYLVILDNANLTYSEDKLDWIINDRYFNGSANDYIDLVLNKMGEIE